MKIVKFKDGTYGIRKWEFSFFWFRYIFKDSKNNRRWWSMRSEWFNDCKYPDLESAKLHLDSFSDIGTPVGKV